MKIKKNGVTINLTESEVKKLSKTLLKEESEFDKTKDIRRITPDFFFRDVKETLWGGGPSKVYYPTDKKSGNPQHYTMLMNNSDEVSVYIGDYDHMTHPDYIIKIN